MTDDIKLQKRDVADRTPGGTRTKAIPGELEPPAPTSRSAPGYGLLLAVNQQAFARWCHGITVLSDEVTQFIQTRLQDDVATWSALASCKTPEEAFECQQRFAEKVMARYSEEITKLSQLMLRLATDGLDSFHRVSDAGPSARARKD